MPKTMSMTAYEIESELRGSAADRTGFGGRPELINFYVGSTEDLSALPVLDKLDVDALRCGKVVPVVTILATVETTIASVAVTESDVTFKAGENSFVYTIATKTWALGTNESEPDPEPHHET